VARLVTATSAIDATRVGSKPAQEPAIEQVSNWYQRTDAQNRQHMKHFRAMHRT
jgi:hypothetical protein